MSDFGYNHFLKGVSPLTNARDAHNLKTLAKTAPDSQFDSLQLTSNESAESDVPRVAAKDINRNSSDNVRYTALKKTSVRELREDDDTERDPAGQDGTDSSTLVNLASNNNRKSIPKIYVIICSLLIAGSILVVFALILIFIILPSSREATRHSDSQPAVVDSEKPVNDDVILVRTSSGSIAGSKEEDIYIFRGIPYTVQPTRSRRWKPPVAIDASSDSQWGQTFNATKFGSKCLQPSMTNPSLLEGSEGCLFLNVWTPSLHPSLPLPVMVWFHSGDFLYGSGHMPGMTPTAQVTLATQAVYVSFNYRLGIFGFLATGQMREESGGAAGNYGFMDQQMALKWVKRNIRQFGGDENQVTIFGHGSGATSVLAMLMSPGSQGLFHKAWLTNPTAVINKTLDEACQDNELVMKTSGCSSVQCLRQLPAETLYRMSPWSVHPHWTLEQLFAAPTTGQIRNNLPVFDGHVLPLSVRGRETTRVPVVFGSTYFDVNQLDIKSSVMNLTWPDYNKLLDQHVSGLGSDAVSRVKALYSDKSQRDAPHTSQSISAPSLQFAHLLGDIRNVCPVKVLTDTFVRMYQNSSSVYMYMADFLPTHEESSSTGDPAIFNGWDIVAFFDTFPDLGLVVGQGEMNFQNILREEIMSFVTSGRPDASRWRTADVNVGVIGRDVTVTPAAVGDFAQCDTWRQYGFFNYTWMKYV